MSDRWRDEDRYGRWDEGRYAGNDYERGFYGASSGPRYGYEDRGRDYGRDRDDRGYGGGYGGRYGESWRGSDGTSGGRRDWTERAGDEVASWFGDEETERRRRQDERNDWRQGRGERWGSSSGYGYGGYGAEERGYRGYGRGGSGRYGESGYGGGWDRDRDYGFGASAGYRGQGYGGYGYGYGGAQWSERDRYGREESRERGFLERAGDEVASWFGDEEAARRRRQDAREGDWSAGQHRGRGPKGYSRSDDRIREDISDRLTDDPHIDASDIEVSVSGSEVTLSGTVDSRFAKRHAEDLAEAVSGVRHVQNNLRVRQSTTGSWSGSSSSAGSTGATGTAGSSGTGTTGATGGTADTTGTGTTGTASGTSVFGGSGRA